MNRFGFVTLFGAAILLAPATQVCAEIAPTTYTLTRNVTPDGGGQVYTSPQQSVSLGGYAAGTTVTCGASPAPGYGFIGWSGALAGTTTPQQLIMNENKSITANFVYQGFTLTKNIYPAGYGDISFDPPPGANGKYTSGTVVTCTATPFGSNTFTGWGSATTGTANPTHITMTGNKTLSAYFAAPVGPVYTLTRSVTPDGGGQVYVSPALAVGATGYAAGTTVTVAALPATGYLFSSWSGAITGTQSPQQIIMNENKSVTANFVVQPPARFAITKQIYPAGGGEIGLNPVPDGDGKYTSGTVVTLTASPATGYTFTAWGGAASGTTSPLQLIMTANKSVTAYFAGPPPPTYTLTRNVTPDGGGQVYVSPGVPSGASGYVAGTSVTVYAIPASGYSFASWSGAMTGSQNPQSLTMNENKMVTANFVVQEQPRFELSKLVNPAGSGTIGANPPPGNDGKYSSGTLVTLTATPVSGNTFNFWSGAVSGTTNPTQILINGNKSVTANFLVPETPPRFTLVKYINPTGSGEIVVSPLPGIDGKYTSGTLLTLTATPATGKLFISWGGSLTGAENPTHLLMNSNKAVVANFTGTEAPRFTLTRSVDPAGSGEISLDPPYGTDGKYTSGTVVTVTAHPFAGHAFAHWTGASDSTNNPVQITMTENKSITAVFSTVSAPSADLSIQLTPLHNPTLVHSPLIVGVEVTNYGPSTATGVQFEFHLSPSTLITTATLSQGYISTAGGVFHGQFGTLASMGHASAAIILTPQTTGTLVCYGTVTGAQPDPFTPNNAAHIEVRVVNEVLPAADLVGVSGNLTRRVSTTGSRIDGTFLFTNNGPVTSKKCRVQYYLSSDNILDALDLPIRSQGIGALRAHGSTSKKFSIRVPANAEGQHVIGVLDSTGVVSENDEVNNEVVSPPVP